MSTIMVLMLGTYRRQFIWIYIFSMGAKYIKYSIPLCVQGVLNLCLWIVPAFLYRVQGHGHITLQSTSMCNVWIDEMWNMVGNEMLLFFFFCCLLFSKEPSGTVRSGKRQEKRVDTWALWLRRLQEDGVNVFFQLVLLLLGHWFGSSGRKELVEPPTVLLVPICGDVQLWWNIPLQ